LGAALSHGSSAFGRADWCVAAASRRRRHANQASGRTGVNRQQLLVAYRARRWQAWLTNALII
jgi:hypothetical protein